MKKVLRILFTFAIVVIMGSVLTNLVKAETSGQMSQTFAQRTVVAEGRFENQPAVDGGLLGAPWRLYNDGVVVVDEGFINWFNHQWWASPWDSYRDYVNEIVFTHFPGGIIRKTVGTTRV